MRRGAARAIAAAVSALGLAASIGAAGCEKKTDAKPEAAGKGGKAGRGGGLAFAVDVLPVEAKRVDYVVSAPGVIDAFERVQVTARVAGPVDRVGFTEGQSVKKNDVLVVIDSERYRLAVNSAKAAVDKARASQQDSEAMVTRREGASATHPGLIPGEELATYQTKTLTAKADTQVALEALHVADLNLRDSFVRAPIDGVIQTRTIETGQYVQAGYVMATLLRADPMLLRFNVEPLDAPRLAAGMPADFTMRETLRRFTAKITLVGGAADPTTHMVPVTAELRDQEHKYWLRPGSFCDVAVTLPAERLSPIIPRSAARATDHGYVAYTIDGDAAHERSLTLGMNTKDGWVEVRSGLAAGDHLVVRGAEALTEGAKVHASAVTFASLAHDAGAKGGDAGAAPAVDLEGGGPPDGGPGGAPDGGHRRAKAAAP